MRTTASRAVIVSIPSEVGRGRALHARQSMTQFSQLDRFNPLGGGAGSGSHHDWQAMLQRHLLSFNPLGGGAGSGSSHPTQGAQAFHVSIPSEVGRGRALLINALTSSMPQVGFNPLGGGAGSGSNFSARRSANRNEFQSPRRWGGSGSLAPRVNDVSPISFNPLGGGAGSGSQQMQKSMEQITASGFQSPRRWGGVGLSIWQPLDAFLLKFQSPRRWGGVGLLRSTVSPAVVTKIHAHVFHVSIPSEVGRGRALEAPNQTRTTERSSSFNPLGGGAGSGSAVAATTGPT